MAGRWIRSYVGIRQRPKFVRLADALGGDELAALGALHALWHWAAEVADEDGRMPDASPRIVARAVGWPHDDADRFVGALVETGWLDVTESGYAVHNWSERGNGYDADVRSRVARYGGHVRWHVKTDRTDPECPWCISGLDYAGGQPGELSTGTTAVMHSDTTRHDDALPSDATKHAEAMPGREDTSGNGIARRTNDAEALPKDAGNEYIDKTRQERTTRAHAWGAAQLSQGEPASLVAKRAMREWGPELAGVAMSAYREAAERGDV